MGNYLILLNFYCVFTISHYLTAYSTVLTFWYYRDPVNPDTDVVWDCVWEVTLTSLLKLNQFIFFIPVLLCICCFTLSFTCISFFRCKSTTYLPNCKMINQFVYVITDVKYWPVNVINMTIVFTFSE